MTGHRMPLSLRLRLSPFAQNVRRATPFVVLMALATLAYPAVLSFGVVASWIGTPTAILAFWVPLALIAGLSVGSFIRVGQGPEPRD